MAKTCGIHIDQQRFYLVALEGSVKKHRIIAHGEGEIPLDEDPRDAITHGLRRIAKEHKLAPESIGLSVDSSLAAFRAITLPFDDRAKIEEVLKFEIENDLPQWNIEEVVVDYVVTGSKPGVESHLLVTALPKERLAPLLAACESAGLEPLDAELDGTALFNAAHAGGVLAPDSAQVLVHVGDRTTITVVVDGGRIVSMRAIRAGSRPLSGRPGDPSEETEEAGEETAEEAQALADDFHERLAQSSARIRRELGRTISGARTEHPIEAILVCGDEMPGLAGEVFDVPVRPLEVVPAGGDLVDDRQRYTVAYGAALSQLGGAAHRAQLRREDLRYSGKFERLELPLAVFSLLLFTMLAVQLITTNKQLLWRDVWDEDPASQRKGDMQIWMQASNGFLLPNPDQGYPGRLKSPPESLTKYIARATNGEDNDRTKYEQLEEIDKILQREIARIEKNLGQGNTEIPKPQSALTATTLIFGVVDQMKDDIGRFAVRRMQADYQPGTSRTEDHVIVVLDMDFYGDTDVIATQHYNNLGSRLREQDWCIAFEGKTSKNMDGGGGIYVDGITVRVDVAKSEEVQP